MKKCGACNEPICNHTPEQMKIHGEAIKFFKRFWNRGFLIGTLVGSIITGIFYAVFQEVSQHISVSWK